MHVGDEKAVRAQMRLDEFVEFNCLQMRRHKAAAKGIENNPIVNRLRVSQKHATVEDVDLVAIGWLQAEIFLR